MSESVICTCDWPGDDECPRHPDTIEWAPGEQEKAGRGLRVGRAVHRDDSSTKTEIVAILRDHWPVPVFGCECTPTDEETGEKAMLEVPWEDHIAALIVGDRVPRPPAPAPLPSAAHPGTRGEGGE